METQPYFGYVSTLSLKSTLIINELHFGPWPHPDGYPWRRLQRSCGNRRDDCAGKPLFRVAVTLDLIPFATCKVRHEDRLAAILDGRS